MGRMSWVAEESNMDRQAKNSSDVIENALKCRTRPLKTEAAAEAAATAIAVCTAVCASGAGQ